MTEPKLCIQMLGDFVLEYNGNLFSGDKIRAKQVWNLLEYILISRGQEVSSQRLMEVLWEEDQAGDPANALKNLAYRLRNNLKTTLGLPQGDYIICRHGSYIWNDKLSIKCVIDVDEFEKRVLLAQDPRNDIKLRLKYYEDAINLYKGDFMPQCLYKEWVIARTIYYQRMFMEAVEDACQLWLAQGDYKKVEEVCSKAIAIDHFAETNHLLLMKALVAANKQSQALQHYKNFAKLLMDELNVQPSKLIQDLYADILAKDRAFAKDISNIKVDLKEAIKIDGAVFCSYDTFQQMYRLEARGAVRSGKSIFLALMTIADDQGKNFSPGQGAEIMAKVKQTIVSSLRKDDVVTKYGESQFLLMLSNLTYEDTNMVLSRLLHSINNSYAQNNLKIYGQIQPLEPIEMGV